MKILALIVVVFLLSCSNQGSNGLASSDSLVIYFLHTGTDVVTRTIVATDKKAIEKVVAFANNTETPDLPCMYDGRMVFYEAGDSTGGVRFNYSEFACRHFYKIEGNKIIQTRMTNEAADFLKSLEAGKSWY